MTISGTVQSLTAAFSFGILLQAATGALLVYWRGHESITFRDGRRLVLILFLLFAALWAQIDFLNLLISPTASTTCQVGLIFSTTFDQLARVFLEQFLLWSVGSGTKLTAARTILQVILGVRVVAGGVLAGFTRPQFAPSCVAHTTLLPVSIVVLVLDGIIIGVLLIQALSLGMFRDMRQSSDKQDQSKAVVLSIFGFAFWTGLSVTMILGLPSILLILRTTLPAIGLLVLVGIILILQGALVSPRVDDSVTPEARSPFMQPLPPRIDMLRDDVNNNGSPIVGRGYTKSGLFVVNPSTPQESPKFNSQGNNTSREDVRTRGIEVNEQGSSQPKNAPGYRGSSGVLPSVVSASLGDSLGGSNQRPYVSHIRPSDVVPMIPAPTPDQKKSLFNRSKPPPKTSIRSLGISKPMVSDAEGFSGPRMETVDLATAAASERERREIASARSRLVANRPAPKPPAQNQTPQEGLRKSISIKRKEPNTRARDQLSPVPSGGSNGSSLVANGSSTSASLSPGHDEVRRRSPRTQNNGFGEKAMPKPTLQTKQVIGLPGNPRARMTLAKEASMAQPQTVMFMKDIVYDNPGVVKTIINGAPDMYAKRPKTAGSESMFPTSGTLQSSGSIIHRPRPYKRGQGNSKDRISFFAGDTSPRRHIRSKSGSAILDRKSILYSSSGSPTKLPPLPQPPTSAANLARILPNDTKSMTFDEKIELLFPAPPGATLLHHRRSSVPSLPRVPSTFLIDERPAQVLSEQVRQSQTASKRITISFGNQTRVLSQVSPPAERPIDIDRQTYRFSANTYHTLADEMDEEWIPDISQLRNSVRNSIDNNPRRSSAVFHNMRQSILSEATSSDASSHGGETTIWGSVHSPTPAVEVSKARARSTFIQNNARAQHEPNPELLQEELDDSSEYVTIGLETEENRKSLVFMSDNNRRSFFLDAGQSLSEKSSSASENGGTWHRRIGDELPTFSERRIKSRSRKMPPPTPLLLKSNGRRASVVVRQAEPSPAESNAEERAIKEIQAQLKHFEEEPTRGSVGSLLQRIPNAGSTEETNDVGERFRLLENLEREMGQQESQWQQMQSNIDRDSISVVITPVAPSEDTLSRKSSESSSRPPSRGVSRRARIRSSMSVRSKGEESASTQSSDNSRVSIWQQRLADAQMEYIENAPALLRKKSLNFLAVNKANLGSPTPPDSEISEADIVTDSEVETERQKAHNSLTKEIPSLWHEMVSSPTAAAGRMWNPPFESSKIRAASPEPPAKNIRPRQHRAALSLPITSTEMWSKPSFAPNSRPVVGLWRSKTVRPASIKVRPVTQRPQRKSKRVTFLPDIIESPRPLPNQRDTLGIFQFPWGERSENPVYQPAFNPALLSSLTMNANLEARSRQLESEEYSSSFFDDYEEDDDEEDDDYSDDEEEPESDDDFDETTLWEIASLLKTDNVPSKNSLFPHAGDTIEEDDDDETDFESASEDEAPKVQSVMVKFPIEPLARSSVESTPRPSLWEGASASSSPVALKGLTQPETNVWQAYIPSSDDVLRSKARTSINLPELATRGLWEASTLPTVESAPTDMWGAKPSVPSVTLAAPGPSTWSSKPAVVEQRHSGLFKPGNMRSTFRTTEAEPAASMLIRTPRQATLALPAIVSQDLWVAGETKKEPIHWTSAPIIEAPKMWTRAKKVPVVDVVGLYESDFQRTDYRTSALEPAALNMVSKVRASLEPMPQLTTRRLWNRRDNVTYERHWISESSVRPSSPSIDSTPSSGRSSPSSETASFRTTSTKASSIWSSISGTIGAATVSKIPSFFDSKAKSPKNDVSRVLSSSEDNDAVKFHTKLPVRQAESKESKTPAKSQPSRSLAPIRESRVFAARDMWEAKAPVLESTPVKKFWKRQPKAATPLAQVKPAHRAMRHQFRPVVAYRANWDEALAEAIQAGTPKQAFVRRAVSASEWDNALAKAISQGKPHIQRPQATPEMWESALSDAVSKSTFVNAPKTQLYNPAVLHPVFFTKTLISSLVDVHPTAIGHVSMPRLERRVTSAAEWDMALAKAISQSVPRMQRPHASSAMWTAALTEAIASSTVSPPANVQRYDPAILHPVFFTESLMSNTSDIHPAAVGHTIQPYDSAVLHPVFFTESLMSNTLDVHPAAIGHTVMPVQVAQPKEVRLWSNPSSADSSVAGSPKDMPMWMKDEIFLEKRLSMFQHMQVPTRRNKAATGVLGLPTLDSNNFWEAAKEIKIETASRDWLSESRSSSQTSSTSTPRMSLATWVPTPPASMNSAPGAVAAVDMFTNIKSEPVKKATGARLASLSRLSSTELFKPAAISQSEVNWIAASSIKTVLPSVEAPRTLTPSFTWVPSSPIAPSSAPGALATTDMFAEAFTEHLRKAAAPRPSALPRLNSTELFKPVSQSDNEVNWIQVSSAKPALTRSQTWVAPSPKKHASAPGAIGSAELFANIKGEHVKRATTPNPAALPRLSSTELFKPASETVNEVNWLKVSTTKPALKRSQTWVAPSLTVATENNVGMWTSSPMVSPLPADMFANVKGQHVKKAASPRPTELPRLSSTELFKPAVNALSEIDWLQASSAAPKRQT